MSEKLQSTDRFIDDNTHHIDEVANVMLRRNLNENYALDPMDFYKASLGIGQTLIGRSLGCGDLVIDVGGCHGEMLWHALIEDGTEATGICVDPSQDALDWYRMEPKEARNRVKFVHAIGESTGLRDNCVQAAMLHNVIFRAADPVAMIREAGRIVVPGGFISISTNIEGHAEYRHRFEAKAGERLRLKAGIDLEIPQPPAAGKYLADLPNLLSAAGLYVVPGESHILMQDTYTIIDDSRLDSFRDAIYASSYGLGIKDDSDLYATWRYIVDEIIDTEVEPIIRLHKDGIFRDPVKRGMYTFINREVSDL